jgi:polar amino acid transport system substrate-binding protein
MESNKNIMNGIQDILGFCQTLTVLYVEDDDEVREQTKEMMEGLFLGVSSAKNGKEGLKEFSRYYQERKKFYDIVITDIQMPVMDGLEMSESIMGLNDKQIIIINSAYSNADNLLQLIDLGITYFLPKPLHFKQLFKILKRVSTLIYSMHLNDNYAKELELLNGKLNKTVLELKKSIEVAENATKLKDDFFANISHEIRTPINAITGFIHLALETNLDTRQTNYLTKIKNSSNHLLGLVNDILDFSKIEAGKLEIENIEFNINTTLDNVSNMIALKAQEKGLEIIYDIDNSVPAFIKGDPLRLGQVIINLMNNAVKFTDKGEITLKAKMSPLPKNKKLLIFEVIDTGIGLKPEHIDNLFQSFSQADSTISRKYGGSGLGLTISKQLVELMGGSIRVMSEYGVGSRFIFSIVTTQPHLRSYHLPSKSLMGKRVLIVDSNPKASAALAQMLRYFQYDSIVASSGEDAELLFINDSFDIVCIDRQIKESISHKDMESHCKAKIVLTDNVLSQSGTKDDDMVDAYLTKPFNQMMIFDMILHLFDVEDSTKESLKVKKVSKDDLMRLEGSHILLAEDNKINQSVILGILDKTGIKVTIASNGKEVVSLSKRLIDIDLILMDINMPILDGYGATMAIRKDSRYNNIPIIALTASGRAEDIQKAKDVGMQEYLEKPINVEKLYTILLDYIAPKAKALQSKSQVSIESKIVRNKIEERVIDKSILDIELAIESLNNDQNLYQTLLIDFVKLTKKSVIKIEALIKTSQREKASTLASDIKNISKRVGALEVLRTIKLVESGIKNHYKELPRLLNNYDIALKIVMDTIKVFFKSKENKMLVKPIILDREEGLARIGNNGELYHEIIFKFYEIFEDSAEKFIELIDTNKFEDAAYLAHYVRGAASNISAKNISDITQRLEDAIKQNSKLIYPILDEYKKALTELLDTIDSFRDTQQ